MSDHALVHKSLGGSYWNPFTRLMVVLASIGGLVALYRFANGLASVANINNGYPWGIWIALDVVVGTALGCGGYAVALLAYVLNKGEYHPLVRPAVLTSLLGYGMGTVGVLVDLGRPWELWKVPIFFWRWTGSPQLEVALCIAAYVVVLLIEASPALLEKLRDEAAPSRRRFAEKTLGLLNRVMPWLLALGILLPTMHQSSLGTMMLLTGPKLHALWSTTWLPFLFLVSSLVMGYGIVVFEATFSVWAFGRQRESAMLTRVSKVALWVGLFWVVFRVGEVAIAGELPLLWSGLGFAFLAEVLLHLGGVVILASGARRASGVWRTRAAMLLVLGGTLYRVNTYLVAFMPGDNFSYFPALPEMFITIGFFAAEIALYIWAVRRFPILAGQPAAAR